MSPSNHVTTPRRAGVLPFLEERIMGTPLRRTLFLLAGVALLGAACGDGGSPTHAAPGRDEARVGFSLDVAGTSVTTIAVEVTAPDITSRLVFNIEAVNGVATGSITIPAGADRTITARAFDAKGILTHEGSKAVTVRGGANASITCATSSATAVGAAASTAAERSACRRRRL